MNTYEDNLKKSRLDMSQQESDRLRDFMKGYHWSKNEDRQDKEDEPGRKPTIGLLAFWLLIAILFYLGYHLVDLI